MIRLAVRCRPELAEEVLAQLLEVAPGGVEESPSSEVLTEFAIYGAPGELPEIPDLEAAVGDGLVEVESSEIPDDWADRWRDFHEPAVIAGGRLVVRPSWRDQVPPAGIDVVVDPGQAFGTGAHPTTRMCIELLLRLADGGHAGGSLVDLGTGSGVLAIAAAKLGFSPVIGCDHERAALEAAGANARANRVELDLRRINLRTEEPPVADTVVANLTAPLLRGIAARPDFTPSLLIASGLLEREAEEVTGAFEPRHLTMRERLVGGEWAALLLVRR